MELWRPLNGSNWSSATRPARQPPAGPRCADVPLRTSLYFELANAGRRKTRRCEPRLGLGQPSSHGGADVELLRPGRRFAEGAWGWLRPKQDLRAPGRSPSTSSRPTARARDELHGPRLGRPRGRVQADPPTPAPGASPPRQSGPSHHAGILARPDVRAGSTGTAGSSRALQRHLLHAGGELRADVRADGRGPQAAPAGLELPARFLDDGHRVPAARVSSPSTCPTSSASARPAGSPRSSRATGSVVLRVEDFFGHEQYGIPGGRPVAEDYPPRRRGA